MNKQLTIDREDLQHFLKTDYTECTLGLGDGTQIAVKQWGNELASIKILALHGFADNANTWDNFAPLLISQQEIDVRIVAMDFAGHGQSSYKASSRQYTAWDNVFDVVAVADALRWRDFVLMGHSMGGAIATLLSAALPERVRGLILVDNCGPFTLGLSPAQNLRRSLQQHPKLLQRRARSYPSYEALLEKYKASDKWGISEAGLRQLADRGHREVEVQNSTEGESGETASKEYIFSHDPRIIYHTPALLDEPQIRSLFEEITCPTIIFFNGTEYRDRTRPRWSKLVQGEVHTVEAVHHIQLEYPEKIYKDVLRFLKERINKRPATVAAKL